MNQNFLMDVGENLEYAKTIIKNEVKLQKLDLIESSAGIVGKVVAGLTVAIISMLVFSLVLGIGIVYLSEVLGSLILALGIVAGFFLLLGLLIYLFRKQIIVKPMINIFYQLFND